MLISFFSSLSLSPPLPPYLPTSLPPSMLPLYASPLSLPPSMPPSLPLCLPTSLSLPPSLSLLLGVWLPEIWILIATRCIHKSPTLRLWFSLMYWNPMLRISLGCKLQAPQMAFRVLQLLISFMNNVFLKWLPPLLTRSVGLNHTNPKEKSFRRSWAREYELTFQADVPFHRLHIA